MPMTAPRHARLGTTVPITEVLDPAMWRERLVYGVILGRGPAPAEDELLGVTRAKTAYGKQVEAGLAEGVEEFAEELPDETIRFHLRSALAVLERRIGMPMGRVVCKATPVDAGLTLGVDYDQEVPRLPYVMSDVLQHYRIDLPPGVISVERVRLYWYNQLTWTLTDTSSIILEHPGTSSAHIMPTTGALFSIASLAASPLFQTFSLYQTVPTQGAARHLPAAWAIDYTLAPTTKNGVQGLEADLAMWVYATAAVGLLAIAGQARTQGVASASIGLDGLSKSVSLAGGGQDHVHIALTRACQAILQGIDLNSVVTYKRGLRFRSTGW